MTNIIDFKIRASLGEDNQIHLFEFIKPSKKYETP